ncbi:restriction endonuclease subunit S [uncultured Ruminococcus sp.]|uniref:restriction endonuclease subunit S n=1 Tax=uncultured Ruminococcus sp. TaxID=165186 RepID=UPI0026659839|nr:restriction endonuclease subunit S [uncultured Ruminococcus sp.]
MREMKDSGVAWIGEIPETWKTMPVKNVFEITRGRVIAKTEIEGEARENYYPVYSSQTANNGVLGYIQTFDYSVDSLTWTTDGAKAGTVFLRRGKYSITNVCGILTLKTSEQCLEFLHYTVSYSAFNCRRADINGYKIMSNEMAIIPIVLPPISTQQKIAAHLDRKCTQIDALISNAQQQIEKLKAYKQSVITETVTKGLDPDVQMKDSGVEWIGEIPEHWKVIRLKFLLQYIIDCPHETPNYSFDGEYYVIRTADEDYGFLRADEQMYRLDEKEYKHRIRRLSLDKDDIVYGREGERWGLACIVPESNKYCLGQRMMQFRCNEHIVPMFIMWALNSKNIYVQGCFDTLGSTSPHVNISTIINYEIPIPSYEEQNKLASFLQEKSSRIDKLIDLKQQKIEKLQQYKKSLIYEYVTGKKEV